MQIVKMLKPYGKKRRKGQTVEVDNDRAAAWLAADVCRSATENEVVAFETRRKANAS